MRKLQYCHFMRVPNKCMVIQLHEPLQKVILSVTDVDNALIDDRTNVFDILHRYTQSNFLNKGKIELNLDTAKPSNTRFWRG